MKPLLGLFLVVALAACKHDCIIETDHECLCFDYWAPVCGCDNVTYNNECEAKCAGVSNYTSGACED
jgi:hypothetical protein